MKPIKKDFHGKKLSIRKQRPLKLPMTLREVVQNQDITPCNKKFNLLQTGFFKYLLFWNQLSRIT